MFFFPQLEKKKIMHSSQSRSVVFLNYKLELPKSPNMLHYQQEIELMGSEQVY